jgi:hypothetical protein
VPCSPGTTKSYSEVPAGGDHLPIKQVDAADLTVEIVRGVRQAQPAAQDGVGTELAPFHEPRKPNEVLPAAESLPL